MASTAMWRPYGTDLGREAAHLVSQFPARGVDAWTGSPAGPRTGMTSRRYVFTELGRIPVGELPPQFAHLVLCRVVGGPVIRSGVRPDWSPGLA